MITVEETDSGLYVTDAAKNELHIEIPDWQEDGEPEEIGRNVDTTISGYASQLKFPEAAVCIETEGRDSWRTYGNETDAIRIEPGRHQIQVSNNLFPSIKLTSSFIINRSVDDSRIYIDLDKNTKITIGLRSRIRRPKHTIHTPTKPESLASAISHLASAFETTTPERSYPSLRGYPPRFKINDNLIIPEEIKRDFTDSGVNIIIPNDLKHLFIAAPLTYYLQANLKPQKVTNPMLEIPNESIQLELSSGSDFENDVVNLMRRVFWLDCLIRNEGEFEVNFKELSYLDQLNINADSLYSAGIGERVSSYLQCDFGSVKEHFPKWHLGTYVKPIEKHISSIPHLLEKLSLIYTPKSKPADCEDLLSYSLDGFQRSLRSKNMSTNSVNKAEPEIPEFQHGRVFGWLADGYPVGVFKAIPESFENKFKYLSDSERVKNIRVILNDPEMEEEKSVVSNRYNERANDLTIDVSVYKNIKIEKLKDLFQQESDLVHYIGHCTKSGLLCKDGYLAASDIGECRAKIFFLNACGSFEEGRNLILKGSVSGVVTRDTILNSEATRIGSTFGNLLVHGFTIENSIRLAREKSMANLEYFVIGDGTYKLTQGDYIEPSYIRIEKNDEEEFELIDMNNCIQSIGGCSGSYISNKDDFWLSGNPGKITKKCEELIDVLKSINSPIMYNGTYYWSDELSIKLQN